MGSLFSKPKTPPPPKVVPMEDPEALAKAKRRGLTKQRSRRGRASTMLSGGDNSSLG